jgi:hypothetical protein
LRPGRPITAVAAEVRGSRVFGKSVYQTIKVRKLEEVISDGIYPPPFAHFAKSQSVLQTDTLRYGGKLLLAVLSFRFNKLPSTPLYE